MFNTFIKLGDKKWIMFLTLPLYEVFNPNMVINCYVVILTMYIHHHVLHWTIFKYDFAIFNLLLDKVIFQVWIGHVLTHHAYWVCQVQLSTHLHGIHQRFNNLLIRNPNHFNIFVHSLFQLGLGIKWNSNGFAILHAKVLENLLEIPNLVDVKKTLVMIPFHIDAKNKCESPRSFISNLQESYSFTCTSLSLLFHTKMRSST